MSPWTDNQIPYHHLEDWSTCHHLEDDVAGTLAGIALHGASTHHQTSDAADSHTCLHYAAFHLFRWGIGCEDHCNLGPQTFADLNVPFHSVCQAASLPTLQTIGHHRCSTRVRVTRFGVQELLATAPALHP